MLVVSDVTLVSLGLGVQRRQIVDRVVGHAVVFAQAPDPTNGATLHSGRTYCRNAQACVVRGEPHAAGLRF